MRKQLAVVGVAGVCLVGASAPAIAAHSHAKVKEDFPSSASPSKGVKKGTTVKIKGHGALKKSAYYCVEATYDTKKPIEVVPYSTGVQVVTSSKSGKISCSFKYTPFSGQYKGKTHACPPSKADAKAGWTCGYDLADQGTSGTRSLSFGGFKTK